MAGEEKSRRSSYDYVIVGSDAGGGALACNLAKAAQRVLLLEAGGDHKNYNYQVPVFSGLATEDEDRRWDYYIRHCAADERQRRDCKFVPDLLRIIKAATKHALVELSGRPLRFWEDVDAFFDPNVWRAQQTDLQGLWITPLATTKAGRRDGTREYIREVQSRFPDNLTVKTNALATKVLFGDDNTAVGVEYLEGAHLYRADPQAGRGTDGPAARRVSVEREVILSASAFNTPQLLKLSGVGPRRVDRRVHDEREGERCHPRRRDGGDGVCEADDRARNASRYDRLGGE